MIRVWMILGLVLGCEASGGGAGSTGSADATGTVSSGTSVETTTGSSTSSTVSTGGSTSSEESGPAGPPGDFTLLTYNVAGLPQGISGSDPEAHMPQISPLLNAYDVVLVQEDFWYHTELSADVMHPHRSIPFPEDPAMNGIGDGLNRFSQFEFGELERVQWYDCHGQLDCASDCLARKGWSYARTTLAPGVLVDVYNLHMEAGGCPEDIEIRQNAAEDLVEAIVARSDGVATIVAGDFNLRRTDPEDVAPFQTILDGAALIDACDAVDCGDEHIDHVLLRSSDDVALEVTRWWVAEEFVDVEDGGPLSDHPAVAVEVHYTPL